MSKNHRGAGIRELPNHGRGKCPICGKENIKVLDEALFYYLLHICYGNLKEFIENHKYEKGRISGVNVDGLFLTPNSKYEDISNLLFNKKIT